MKILLDTSVLVAAMVESHPAHQRALSWLQKIGDPTHEGLVAAHSIAELYAVLTSLPVKPRISPSVARRLIDHNVLKQCKVLSLSAEDYVAIVEHLSEIEILGGATYDALIFYAAVKADADRVVTFNVKDFVRVYPTFADKVVSPSL